LERGVYPARYFLSAGPAILINEIVDIIDEMTFSADIADLTCKMAAATG
jgi:hypothetical protein